MIRASVSRSNWGVAALPKFFLIDQSLEGLGSHHFDFALCVSNAAQQAGWETIVAAHRRFVDGRSLGAGVRSVRVFRNTTYSKCSFLAGLAAMARHSNDDVISKRPPGFVQEFCRRAFAYWSARQQYRKRRLLIRQFATDCEKFFAPHIFEDGDQVLLAGASELDLMGLAAFLSTHPRTNQVQWNVLCHFNVFNGCPVEYASQFQSAQRVRRCFESALARIPYHNVRFLTTTDELADQYNRLRVASFSPLTYPVNSQLASTSRSKSQRPSDRPLRITLAGAVRREKGQCQVAQSIVDELWDEFFASGRAELHIQRPRRANFLRPKIEIQLPETPGDHATPIKYLDHPLRPDEYAKLIRSTDVGLLAYDPHAYYARRAGILGEYLAAGRPVIVLGGSWLAEQIHDSTQRHVREMIDQYQCGQPILLEKMACEVGNVPQNGGIIAFDRGRRPFQAAFKLPLPVKAVAIEYRCHFPVQSGAFCRIELRQFAEDQELSKVQAASIGTRSSSQTLATLFTVDPSASRFQVRFSNACDDSSLSLRNVCAIGLNNNGKAAPLSAVGVVAADAKSLPDAIREVVLNYAHYRESAKAFAPLFWERHRPEMTFNELVNARMARAKSA